MTKTFFDDLDAVSRVFDFEMVAYAPKVFELVRFLMFMFLQKDSGNTPTAQAKLYLESYIKIYPISKEEIRTGFTLYYLRMLHGFWAQNEHYIHNNFRVDQFLLAQFNSIKYLFKHLEELKNFTID